MIYDEALPKELFFVVDTREDGRMRYDGPFVYRRVAELAAECATGYWKGKVEVVRCEIKPVPVTEST